MRGLAAARFLARAKAAPWASVDAHGTRCFSTELPDSLLPVVAIIGRPNVGKSALFNRLVRRREAVVHDTPGGHVTRDYQEGVARLADLRFRVIDTSGLEPFLPGGTIQARATALTSKVLSRSDVALFLVDGSTGTLPGDEQLARWLRKTVVGRSSGGSSGSDVASSSDAAKERGEGSGSSSSSSDGDLASSSSGSRGASSSNDDGTSSSSRHTSGKACVVLLAANKCERRGGGGDAVTSALLAESMRLGMGEPVALSAMTGEGMTDLYAALQPLLDPIVAMRQAAVQQLQEPASPSRPQSGDGSSAGDGAVAEQGQQQQQAAGGAMTQRSGTNSSSSSSSRSGSSSSSSGPLRIAIMGLPNVGKSTLANRLLQEERCLTGPEPGLTRDAIKQRITWQGREVELVDTAGWIRRTKLSHYDESGGAVAGQTVAEARSVMQFVHVVALLVDAQRALELGEGLTHREVTLAADVVAEGRLLLIVANKLDALSAPQREQAMGLIRKVVEAHLPDVSGVPVLPLSALTGRGTDRLLPVAVSMYERWNQRVPTSQLNRWVAKKASEYAVGGGKELNRVSYLSQVKARPPTFVVWVSGSTPLSATSQRFMAAQIRREFGFAGVPLRVSIRYKLARRLRTGNMNVGRGGRRR